VQDKNGGFVKKITAIFCRAAQGAAKLLPVSTQLSRKSPKSAAQTTAHQPQTRHTRQRDAVLRVLDEAAGPLSAREIHRLSAQYLPQIGIATVYRTLKMLQESGDIRSVILPSGEPRYKSTRRGHGDHFLCRGCDRAFELENCPFSLLPPQAETHLAGEGFHIEAHEMTFFGLCPQCSTGKKTKISRIRTHVCNGAH
jgi:Fur family transcriptional regulator, ferric uptake regulator